MPERSRSDEFMSRQRGPGNAGSFARTSTSFTSTTSTARGRDPSRGGGASPGTSWRHGGPHPQHPVGGASAYPSDSAAHRPTSFSLHSLGDFDTLETRLQKALDSPTLLVSYYTSLMVCHTCKLILEFTKFSLFSMQASDRSFLEELLMYLRQQRRQLDESHTLLERLEQQQQREGSIPPSFHIDAADSGTVPLMTTPTRRHSANAGASGTDLQGHVGPTRVITTGMQAGVGSGGSRNGAKMDLSSLYEQCE